MSYSTLFVTHVELSSHFIKIHGQTNRQKAQNIELCMPTVINIFRSFPEPVINMLNVNCKVLVYCNNGYFRGRFLSADAGKTANVLLIDLGFMVTVELANLRILDLAPKVAEYLINEPPQATEFILSRCIISHDSMLSKIQDDILNGDFVYNIDDEICNIKRISLKWKGHDYTEYLINSKICQSITADQQKKYLSKPLQATAARPVNKSANSNAANVRSSINTTGMQMISNHLGVRSNKVPQNMPSYRPRVSPSMDFNSNNADTAKPSPVIIQNDQQTSNYVPTFMSDTLIVHGRHQVYISYVDDGPYMFSIQLKSAEQRMEEMMAAIAQTPLQPLSRRPAFGMACLARFSGDNNIYRAVIKSINPDSCQLLYVDYGNSETVLHNSIYNIPEDFLRPKTFALRFSLAGLNTLPAINDQVKAIFKDMVNERILDMVVVPADGKAFVQYCELSLNGESLLKRIKDIVAETPKFIEPTPLTDGDFVVIRYVESPKLFCVQQTKNIVEYETMMDKLCHYCMTAPLLNKFVNGVACAARFKNDSEWYRAEIVNVNGDKALTRFVDYGIELNTEVNTLKQIRHDFLLIPKQAVRCCLIGFDSVQTPSNSSQDQMELLAEDSVGERRNFRVKIHGNVDDAVLVNLTDESMIPNLNLSMRMLQLSMPQKSLRHYEAQKKMPNIRSTKVLPADSHAGSSERATSDSGFQDCVTTSTRISNWDTPQHTPDRDQKTNARNNYRDDSGITSSHSSSPGIDAKDSKFYKNNNRVNLPYDSNDQRNVRPTKPYTSSNARCDTLSPQGVIDPNTQIPVEAISINKVQEVKLSWFFSPLEFYVTTANSDADLDYTIQMKNIHHFYKSATPIAKNAAIGSLVIAKFSKNNQLHRARITDFNANKNQYKVQLIDVGAMSVVDASDVYEMDKIFAKLECQAIKCSLSGVALRASPGNMQDTVEKLMDNKTLVCKFIQQKEDTFYVDIVVGGVNVKDTLIRAEYLSILAEDIEIERLVGQIVIAQIVSFKDLSSFQINVCGCETIFEASYRTTNYQPGAKPNDKKLPTGATIPIRIDSLLLGKFFAVTPLIDPFGGTTSPICSLSFFSNNFKVVVMHWESCNVAYVQSLTAHNFTESMLNELFEFYEISGDILQEFLPQTLCAVKSADENWYRAEIISETQAGVNVRYLDYGNCEVIPKSLVKRLESQFYNTAALAVKVFLPLNKVYSDKETSVDEIAKLTVNMQVDLKVLEHFHQNWIVDLLKDGTSLTAMFKAKKGSQAMTVEELKKQIIDIESAQKVAKFQIQKPNSNHEVVKSPVTIVTKETQQMKQPTASSNTQSTTEQTKHQHTPVEMKAPGKTASTTKAFISHIDRPDRFYLQISSITAHLEKLQENIQIVAPSLPALEDFSNDTRCIVRYSVDDQWYRAVIIDSDSKITSILFIDYGNTDTITDNSLIKSMNEVFDQIPAYAIPCALPLEAKDRIEWSEESCEVLKSLVDDELEFEFVCKGKSNNFVKLYHGDRDIMAELIQNGHAIKLDSIVSGANCYVSHVNSISDFYIQMKSDTDALEKVSDFLLDESKFNVMTDIKEGVVCAAKYLDDGLWYRGKILSHTAGTTEVFFIDYGNSSETNDLRIIPTEIANAPSLAKYCSLVKPKDIQYWSENAERRFMELTDTGTIFLVDVISPGKKSVVDLVANGKSILEEISNLCDKYSLSALEKTLQSTANASSVSETFKAVIVDGTPDKFYIQLDSDSSELDRLWGLLETASTWPMVDEIAVGGVCAALFEGNYYRAKIVSLSDDGALVHYVDYGNNSFSSDLRKLPESLQTTKHLAICCSLESKNASFSPQTIERFASLSREDAYEMKYVSIESSPVIVQLFEKGVLFVDKIDAELAKPTDKIKAYISEMVAPNHFYIQLNNDMEEVMATASEFPLLEDSYKRAGKRCAAFWEGAFYRADILAIDENGTKVHFIDYGNESYATDLRELPENLAKIERASMLCKLECKNDVFSSDFTDKFANLNLDDEYEFEIVIRASTSVVRLYVNGQLFSDGQSDNVPKNGQIKANSDSIVENSNEASNQRSVANDIVAEVAEISLNESNAIDKSLTSIDVLTEANRIQAEHFKSIESTGLGAFPANL